MWFCYNRGDFAPDDLLQPGVKGFVRRAKGSQAVDRSHYLSGNKTLQGRMGNMTNGKSACGEPHGYSGNMNYIFKIQEMQSEHQ